MYQFSDLDDYLKSEGKEDIRKAMQTDIQTLLSSWKALLSSVRVKPSAHVKF
jgi:hypothetical protein